MRENAKVQAVWSIVVSITMVAMFWDGYNKKTTIETQKKQLDKAAELSKKQNETMDRFLVTIREKNTELEACHSDLEIANVHLKESELKNQPCPGPCGLPDCRKLLAIVEIAEACFAFVEQQKVNLGVENGNQ